LKKNFLVPEYIFRDINYYQYLIQYQGDIEAEITIDSGYYVTIINDKYAILVVPASEVEIDIRKPEFTSIVYIKPTEMYTLQSISPIEASKANFLQLNLPLNLTGKNIYVAIIDTGIDYLNEEFMKSNGETRIELIWDQTIISSKEYQSNLIPYGTVYTKNEIQEAIKSHRDGGSPYEIVPSKDEIGHGTNMAGIIGATGKNPKLKGVVPECHFIVIKLLQDYAFEARFQTEVPVYSISTIFTALEFLNEYALTNNRPMVIYFPLGSNFGNHKGNGILDEFIEIISITGRIVVVCGTGNQSGNGTHTSGVIDEVGGIGNIEIQVSPKQIYLWVEIWVDLPNIMTVDIISPSGENTGTIPVIINSIIDYDFVFERTSIKVNYYLPEEHTGDELIRIRLYDLKPGIWIFKLTGKSILNGVYNVWLAQDGITVGNTRIGSCNDYGTITTPGSSTYTVTVAAYNQNNNNLLDYSGRALLSDYADVIDVAAGGVNAITVAPNNQTAIVNGTSVSAAVVAGVCAMLFEWGIIEGNDPYIHSQTIKAYIARGTTQRSGDSYPNPLWGYGILDVLKLFENIT
jgi:subtilisin family serine protease